MLVVSWTNVAVLYHDFPYFFCIAAISSFVFEIFAYDVVGNISRQIASIKKEYFIHATLIQIHSLRNRVSRQGSQN